MIFKQRNCPGYFFTISRKLLNVVTLVSRRNWEYLSFNWRIYACPYFVVFSDIFILFFSQSSSRHSTITYCRHFSWMCHWPCCFFLCYNRHHHHKVNVNCVHLHAIFYNLSSWSWKWVSFHNVVLILEHFEMN